MTIAKKINWADKLGIASAILCIIHCLAAPLLLTMGISFLHNPVIALLFIIIAFISIYKTTKGSLFNKLSIILWIAFCGFVLSIILEERSKIFKYTMYLSSIILIIGHSYKMHYCSKK